jgi:hypothetical protein
VFSTTIEIHNANSKKTLQSSSKTSLLDPNNTQLQLKIEIGEEHLKYLLFCDFLNLKNKENRLYEEVKDLEKLKQVFIFDRK